MSDQMFRVGFGEYGGKFIPAAAATVTPDNLANGAPGSWGCLEILNDIEITALVGSGFTYSAGTKTLKAGTRVEGIFTSITTTATSAGGLIWAKNRKPL